MISCKQGREGDWKKRAAEATDEYETVKNCRSCLQKTNSMLKGIRVNQNELTLSSYRPPADVQFFQFMTTVGNCCKSDVR